MKSAQREAQLMAYQALQEALDRRDNGGRSGALAESRVRLDERDTALVTAGSGESDR